MSAMPSMLKYALRYTPLLALTLLLLPLRAYLSGTGQQFNRFPLTTASPFSVGTALYSVATLPSGAAWAVGGTFSYEKQTQPDQQSRVEAPTSGIILQYTNGVWQPARVASSLPLPLFSVSLDSPHDGWAVGYGGTLVHFDGLTWSIAPGPARFNKNLLGVAMLSPSNGWAVGYGGSILHYDGRQWLQETSPTQFDLRSVAMPSAQAGWAVGDHGVILRYANGAWSAAASPTTSALNDVSMLSTAEGWAVGQQGTILHYRVEDDAWNPVFPDPYSMQDADLYSISMSNVRSGWIVGNHTFLVYSSEVWSEPGKQYKVSTNFPYSKIDYQTFNLYSIVSASFGEAWAVGRALSNSSTNNLAILHYQHGAWSVALSTG